MRLILLDRVPDPLNLDSSRGLAPEFMVKLMQTAAEKEAIEMGYAPEVRPLIVEDLPLFAVSCVDGILFFCMAAFVEPNEEDANEEDASAFLVLWASSSTHGIRGREGHEEEVEEMRFTLTVEQMAEAFHGFTRFVMPTFIVSWRHILAKKKAKKN